MKWLICVLVFSWGMSAYAQENIAELYGRADGLSAPEISPNGEHIAAQCAPNGTPSICIFDIVNGSEPIYIQLNEAQRLQEHYWVNDKYLVFVYSRPERLQTDDGLDDYLFRRAVAFDITSKKSAALMSDISGTLDTSRIVALLPDKDRKVLMSGYTYSLSRSQSRMTQLEVDRGNDWSMALMEVDLKNGKSKRKKTLSPRSIKTILNPDGRILAELRYSDNNLRDNRRNYSIVANRKTIFEINDVATSDFSLLGYDAQSDKLLVFFDTDQRDGLYSMSLTDGAVTAVTFDGFLVGRAAPISDFHTQSIVGFTYTDDLQEQVFFDPTLKKAKATLDGALKDKRVTLRSWDEVKQRIVVRAEGSGQPADYYVFNTQTGELGGLGGVASHIKPDAAGEVIGTEFAARDGMIIPTYVTLPPGKMMVDGPFPLIVMPHGGPQSRDTARFDWWAQAYAAQGYAVVQPNFRGSTGYGLAHQVAGYGEFGGKMVQDVVDAAAWATTRGLTKPDTGYCVVGASYGGYAALMAAVLDAGDIKCAISVNGVSQPLAWKTRFYDGGEADNYIIRYLGEDEFSEDRGRSITPAARASEISAPVLLIHGKADMRVPSQQSKGMADALSGKADVTLQMIEGEDHFLQTTRARHSVLDASLKFLGRHLPVD